MDGKRIDKLIEVVNNNSDILKEHMTHVDAKIKEANTTFTNTHNNFVFAAKSEQMSAKYEQVANRRINAIYKAIDATNKHINAVIYGRDTTRWVVMIGVAIAAAIASGFMANYITSLI